MLLSWDFTACRFASFGGLFSVSRNGEGTEEHGARRFNAYCFLSFGAADQRLPEQGRNRRDVVYKCRGLGDLLAVPDGFEGFC